MRRCDRPRRTRDGHAGPGDQRRARLGIRKLGEGDEVPAGLAVADYGGAMEGRRLFRTVRDRALNLSWISA